MDFLTYPIDDLEIRKAGSKRTLSGIFRYGRTAVRSDRGRVRKERFSPDAFSYSVRRWGEIQKKFSDIIDEGLSQIKTERDRITDILEQERARANIFILSGHDFNKPLGSTKAGNVRISSNQINFVFEVDLPEERNTPTYLADLLKQIDARIIDIGISPGFRVPPRSAVPNAEELVQDPGETVLTRLLNDVSLKEMSLVSNPNYAGTEVELRNEDFGIHTNTPSIGTLWL